MLFVACHPFHPFTFQTTSPSALHSSDGVFGDKRRRLRESGFDGRPRLRGEEVGRFLFPLLDVLLRRLLIIV